MFLAARAFAAPKKGNSAAEYEDSYWPQKDAEWDVELFRYSVADGATQTSFSKAWADLLVRAYCKGNLNKTGLVRTLEPLQAKWLKIVSEKPLPWFAQEKVRQGAFATLLGLTMMKSGVWNAQAVGDSCLFQVRKEKLIHTWPLQAPEDFDNSPILLSSNPRSNQGIESHFRETTGTWEPGDLFLLMTDALACWFLKIFEREQELPTQLITVNSEAEFNDLIESQRTLEDSDGRRMMRNDDVTLLRIYVD